MKEQMTQKLWAVVTPKGRIMPSTISKRPQTAKKRCLEQAEQKYNALVEMNFKKWEQQGYRCERMTLIRG